MARTPAQVRSAPPSQGQRPAVARRLLALALALLPLPSCQTFGVEHMLGADDPFHQHRWHTWPARVGMFLVTVPLTVVFAPFAAIEDVTTGSSLFRKQSPGITSYMVGVPASVGAYATALPFFLVGIPWEFGGRAAPPPPKAEDDEDEIGEDN